MRQKLKNLFRVQEVMSSNLTAPTISFSVVRPVKKAATLPAPWVYLFCEIRKSSLMLRLAIKQTLNTMTMNTNRSLAARIAQCGLLLAASTLVASDVEDRLTQSYQVKPGGKLAVEADRGSIEVKSADGEQVAIEVLRKVSREGRARAEEVLKNHEVKFTQNGDTVQVGAELNSGWASHWRDKGKNLQVR